MILYFAQIEELLTIIDKNQIIVSDLGKEILTKADIELLLKYGIDFKRLYVIDRRTVFTHFNFAMLAESLRVIGSSNFEYDELKEFIKKGEIYTTIPKR